MLIKLRKEGYTAYHAKNGFNLDLYLQIIRQNEYLKPKSCDFSFKNNILPSKTFLSDENIIKELTFMYNYIYNSKINMKLTLKYKNFEKQENNNKSKKSFFKKMLGRGKPTHISNKEIISKPPVPPNLKSDRDQLLYRLYPVIASLNVRNNLLNFECRNNLKKNS